MEDLITILGARRRPVSDADEQYVPKEQHLFIGKDDKSISVASGEKSVLLSVLPELILTNEYTGKINIATDLGNFTIQWGVAVAVANSTSSIVFPTAFERECFGVVVSQKDNDAVTGLMAKPTDKMAFSLTISGGASNETIQWVAFGY